jgi:hypothetical protein
MRSNLLFVSFLSLSLVALAACGGRKDESHDSHEGHAHAPDGSHVEEAKPAAAAPAATDAGHAPQGFVPGSHEDWCGEHAVPESKCTRCNPSLVPAFKAVNDWCAEHALPESQCLKCHPELKIERPPKPTGA